MPRWIETDTLSNQDISSALAIGATADADRLILVQFLLTRWPEMATTCFITQRLGGQGRPIGISRLQRRRRQAG